MVAWRSWLPLGIAVFVALGVPAASPATPVHEAAAVDLALLPLKKAQLGRVGESLALTLNSGSPYDELGSTSIMGAGPWDAAKLGEGDADSLDYGRAFTGCGCVTEIRTSVERFRSAAVAAKRLAYWKLADEHVVRLDVEPGLAVDVHRFVNVPAVGTHRYAYLTEYDTRGLARRARVVDERFADGRFVFQVEIHWGSGTSGIAVASRLARKLDTRLHLALTGRLDARPAKLPPPPGTGPPPGGPDLSAPVLQQSDLPPAALGPTVGYSWNPVALWHYQAAFRWGAHKALYQSLSQDIEWHATANEAAFWSAYEEAYEIAGYVDIWPRKRTHVTSVNLDGIRRGERATIIWFRGGSGSFAVIGLARGHVTDVVAARSNMADLPVADVQALAQATATRLDAGVPG